ncbi:MAG: Sensory box histidine kinase/response regulator [Myxococcaceae bacterium]|nr:Sensory box histidine kinase/response regulator [Myxococcaceae bacterium]
MDRKEALDIARALLEAEGKTEALAEVRSAFQTLEAYERHGKTIADVTRSLLESEKTYRLVFSHEIDPMSLFDPATGCFLDVNESWVKLYGYTRDEALKMKVTEVSAEPAQTKKAIASLPAGATTRIDVRWHRAKDGTVFPVELTAGSLTLNGRAATYAVMRDITARQRTEAALARSEASFRTLIESMRDAVLVHRDGKMVYLSPSGRSLLGYGADEDVVGAPIQDTIHPDDRARLEAIIYKITAHGVPTPLLEERLVRRDGTHVIAEIAAFATVYDGEAAVLAILRDLTARKELEAQLVMNDRLASLGRLSASIGHELNTPLAYVLGNLELIERDLARATELPPDLAANVATYVGLAGEGARRMRDIVYDLKTLARADGQARGPIDVQHILDTCINMGEHELRRGTKLVKDYRDVCSVSATESSLGQVFLNLLVNAAHAIPESDSNDNEVRVVVRASGDEVIVEISDTGVGIPREHLDRIFEPFFTTKQGLGTGLGLSISHRIVRSVGGTLTCEPRPGRGTLFRVVLPSADPAV